MINLREFFIFYFNDRGTAFITVHVFKVKEYRNIGTKLFIFN